MKKQHSLSDDVTSLKGVGKVTGENLLKINIKKVEDLLFHLPIRYQNKTKITQISEMENGCEYLFDGHIDSRKVLYRGKRNLVCSVNDGTGVLELRFFHFTKFQLQNLSVGQRIIGFGVAKQSLLKTTMFHPEYQIIDTSQKYVLSKFLTPIYRTTEGVQQKKLFSLIQQALTIMNASKEEIDLLPHDLIEKNDFPPILTALNFVHRPDCKQLAPYALQEHLIKIKKRLAIEEIIAHQLKFQNKSLFSQKFKSKKIVNPDSLRKLFLSNLDFSLTKGQLGVIKEIDIDLKSSRPMNRLLQGDVGSGKTVIAAAAFTKILCNNQKVALMAPTELLAEQHYKNIKSWYANLEIETLLLTGNTEREQREYVLSKLLHVNPLIVIGTHSLFQKEVVFKNLGLCIFDEQHRFGVEQRLRLLEKSNTAHTRAHQLLMTATPIPRTLAMTYFSKLDISNLRERPAFQKEVQTFVMSETNRSEIVKRIVEKINKKQQIYWVCPLIEESDIKQKQAATLIANQLTEQMPLLNIGLIHGKLKEHEKETIMRAFQEGKIDLLVATTIIEVGVDVPNATLIIIENSENLGLSQLHQLRGRVGRGKNSSKCLLLYKAPLGDAAKERLDLIRETTDGFKIADRDLKMRGPGQLKGKKQSGFTNFKIANFETHEELFHQANRYLTNNPQLSDSVMKKLTNRWESSELLESI